MSEQLYPPQVQTGTASASERAGFRITSELVRQVADRVYALLLREMEMERERQRKSSQTMSHNPLVFKGGR